MEYGLRFFAQQISNSTVALFADNCTAISYLRNQGGTRFPLLNSIAQRILRWAESLPVVLASQFIMGRNNVLADSLSRPNQILGSEWTLEAQVFRHLSKSPMLSIFFSVPRSERSGHGCSAPELEWVAGVYFSSLVSHSCGIEGAPVVLWSRPDYHCSVLASETLVSGAARSSGGQSDPSSLVPRPPETAALPSSSSWGVRAVSSCVETIQRFARSQGFSSHVARQASLARRSSSRAGYQAKWAVYQQWCRLEGHSISRPSLPKVADFLFWLRRSRKLSVSAVMGYRSMLSAVFRLQLPEISSSSVIHDLLRSFKVEAPCRAVRPPSWDLEAVLRFLRSTIFEPLASSSLRDLTRKTLFLVALATAKRVGEIQALSCVVSFSSSSAGLSYVSEFLAKTETAVRPLPCSFSIQSLQDFAAGLPEDLLFVRSAPYVSI